MVRNKLTGMNGQNRSDIHRGLIVDIVLKKDQASGILTRLIVDRILTSKPYHPRGIKIMGTNGMVGRVQYIIGDIDITNIKVLGVGKNNNSISNYNTIESEILEIKKYNMDIYLNNRLLGFEQLDNNRKDCMFNVIRNDRLYRMYNPTYDIPPMYAEFHIINNTIVRLCYYEYINNELTLTYDFRNKILEQIKL